MNIDEKTRHHLDQLLSQFNKSIRTVEYIKNVFTIHLELHFPVYALDIVSAYYDYLCRSEYTLSVHRRDFYDGTATIYAMLDSYCIKNKSIAEFVDFIFNLKCGNWKINFEHDFIENENNEFAVVFIGEYGQYPYNEIRKSDSESEDNEEIVECAVQELDKPNKNGRVYTKDAIINEDE